MRHTTWLVGLVAAASVPLLPLSAVADDVPWIEDTCNITLGTGNPGSNFVGGGGTGYPPDAPGQWYYYPATEWWNQWFYDHPFMEDPWYKEIEIFFVVCNLDPAQNTSVEVAVNWSTPAWSREGNPPGEPRLPPLPGVDEALYIYRDTFFSRFTEGDDIHWCVANDSAHPVTYLVDTYNPEWVSIDVKGYNCEAALTIRHRCIPEPATAALLTLGSLGLLRRRR